MRAPELFENEWYAVKTDRGTVVQALYRGQQTPPNAKKHWNYVRPCFSTLDDSGVEEIFYLPSCHRVICPWDDYGTPRERVDISEDDISHADAISEGIKDAMFQVQSDDVEVLASLLLTLDINAGVAVVSIAEGDSVKVEPALFIRYNDASKMLKVAREMALYSDTADLLD